MVKKLKILKSNNSDLLFIRKWFLFQDLRIQTSTIECKNIVAFKVNQYWFLIVHISLKEFNRGQKVRQNTKKAFHIRAQIILEPVLQIKQRPSFNGSLFY